MLNVVNKLQADRFGPLTRDCLTASDLDCLVWELIAWTPTSRALHGRVGGSFPSPSKDDETTDSSFCQDGCPGKDLLSTYLRMMMLELVSRTARSFPEPTT